MCSCEDIDDDNSDGDDKFDVVMIMMMMVIIWKDDDDDDDDDDVNGDISLIIFILYISFIIYNLCLHVYS